MPNEYNTTDTFMKSFSISHLVIRLISSTIVLGITAALTPGFYISGIWALILGAVVLAIIDMVLEKVMNLNASPFGRGLVGFILAAFIIYVTQFFVVGYNVTILGAFIGAIIYGIVDAIIPGKAM